MKSKLFGLLAGISIYALAVQPAAANLFTFVTPLGSTSDGQTASAEADITTSAGSLMVVLKNLLSPSQIISAGQAISDLSFTLGNAPGMQGTLTASGQQADIGAGGTVTNVPGSPGRFIGCCIPRRAHRLSSRWRGWAPFTPFTTRRTCCG